MVAHNDFIGIAGIKADYKHIKQLIKHLEKTRVKSASVRWHGEIAKRARKANEWLEEMQKLEANIRQARGSYHGAERKVMPGFRSTLTGKASKYGAGEDWCAWHVQSRNGPTAS